MKSTNSYKKSIMFIFSIFIIAICTVVGWTSIISNAFATDDEATPQEATTPQTQEVSSVSNELTRFSLQFIDLEEGVMPDYSLYDERSSEFVEYTPGQYLDIEVGAEYTAETSKGYVYLTVKDSSHTYSFIICDPIGYDWNTYTYPGTITEETDLIVEYTKYTDLYSINVLVEDNNNQAVSDCAIKYFDNNWNLIRDGITGPDGRISFNDLTNDEAEGIVFLNQEGYLTDDKSISSPEYEKGTHAQQANLTAKPDSSASIKLSSNDENHLNFEATWELSMIDDPTLLSGFYYKLPSLAIMAEPITLSGNWIVAADGKIVNTKTIYESYSSKIELNPLSNEGYSIDHWTIDKGDGNKFDVKPNDTFSVDDGETIRAEAFYTNSPQPGPTPPEPTPTPSEEVNATAQTGDSSPAIPFAILAIVSCAAVVFSRKKSFNK